MKDSDIQNFWQHNPCGAQLVGDMSGRERDDYAEFFDRYDAYRYSTEPHILTNLDTIDLERRHVLEIGLGQGSDAEQIARRGALYSGIDLTREAVERTRMRFALKGLSYQSIEQADAAEAIPFSDASFDVVYSFGVLHHIPNIAAAAREIYRVLKPDGRLLVMLYAKHSLNYWLSIFFLRRLGLAGLYLSRMEPGGIYSQHLENARSMGLRNYLRMSNFINRSTDGPHNPYSKAYSLADVRRDFSQFEIVSSSKYFMHAPPLKVGFLPFESWMGWHLCVELKKR